MTQTIEQLFADLCVKHDLTTVNVDFTPSAYKPLCWLSYVHFEGGCASGSAATAHEAIAKAIQEAAVKRADIITVPADIMLETVA